MTVGGDTLIPGSFDYMVAHSVDEAVALLDQHGDEAKILAGGQSLIPLVRFRLARPSILIDINRVDGLEYIQETDGVLHIGAMTREADLDSSSLIRDRYPILLDTSSVVADPVVRNWATVGGNIAHADPANDHPATMLALGAQVVALGPAGNVSCLLKSSSPISHLRRSLPPMKCSPSCVSPARANEAEAPISSWSARWETMPLPVWRPISRSTAMVMSPTPVLA